MFLSHEAVWMFFSAFKNKNGLSKTITSALTQFLTIACTMKIKNKDLLNLCASQGDRVTLVKEWENFIGEKNIDGTDNSIKAIKPQWDDEKIKTSYKTLFSNFLSVPLQQAHDSHSKLKDTSIIPDLPTSSYPKVKPLLYIGLGVDADFWGVELHSQWKDFLPNRLENSSHIIPYTSYFAVMLRKYEHWQDNLSLSKNILKWVDLKLPQEVAEFFRKKIKTEVKIISEIEHNYFNKLYPNSKIFTNKRKKLGFDGYNAEVIKMLEKENLSKANKTIPDIIKQRFSPAEIDTKISTNGNNKVFHKLILESYINGLKLAEQATKKHQTYLANIKDYLKTTTLDIYNLTYTGNGCDLLIMNDRKNVGIIIEIKTTTEKNFFSQCRAAIGQLVEYHVLCGYKYSEIKLLKIVAIESIDEQSSKGFSEYIYQLFSYCCIKVIFINEQNRWKDELYSAIKSFFEESH